MYTLGDMPVSIIPHYIVLYNVAISLVQSIYIQIYSIQQSIDLQIMQLQVVDVHFVFWKPDRHPLQNLSV